MRPLPPLLLALALGLTLAPAGRADAALQGQLQGLAAEFRAEQQAADAALVHLFTQDATELVREHLVRAGASVAAEISGATTEAGDLLEARMTEPGGFFEARKNQALAEELSAVMVGARARLEELDFSAREELRQDLASLVGSYIGRRRQDARARVGAYLPRLKGIVQAHLEAKATTLREALRQAGAEFKAQLQAAAKQRKAEIQARIQAAAAKRKAEIQARLRARPRR